MIEFKKLKEKDPELFAAMEDELNRQQNNIELIASENFVSEEVMAAVGSHLTNKYAEGYPAHRYYGGCQFVDVAENLAIERAKKLFGCEHANVQPHSGANANFAVYFAVLKPAIPFSACRSRTAGTSRTAAPSTFRVNSSTR